MSDSIIRDYKAEVLGVYERLDQLVHELDSCGYLTKMKEIKAAIDKSEPSLMFYGIYNAGKSSLLNAIFGKVVASVNDIPETHKVTRYQWGKYTLVDTPGLNGPVQDEKITVSEVKKHDIIMFVIDDSDNFDSDVITKKIIEILEAGKPCTIVINTKNKSEADRILDIKDKMGRNILSLSAVAQNYEFIAVDAVSALKAKREDKKMLLEHSNIKELEYCISNKLASVGSVRILRVPLDLMIVLCDKIHGEAEREIEHDDLKRLYKLKQNLFQCKENIGREFSVALHHMVSRYGEQIYQQLSANGRMALSEEECEREVQELGKKYMARFAEESNLTIERFVTTCKIELSLAEVPEETPKDDWDKKMPIRQAPSKDGIDVLLDSLESLSLGGLGASLFVEGVLEGMFPFLLPIPIIVGAVKALKNWIFGEEKQELPDVEEWNRQQEEHAQKRELALREIRNQIAVQMDEFERKIKKVFLDQLEAAYEKGKAGIDNVLREQEGKNSERVRQQEIVEQIKGKASFLLEGIR